MGPSKDPKSKQQDFKQEDVLQAVLIADGFSSSSSSSAFGPLTVDSPASLLPLASSRASLLDYALRLLVASGVRDLFVVSTVAFAAAVKTRVDAAVASEWFSSSSSSSSSSSGDDGDESRCRVTQVIADGAASVGDALREIDKTGAVKNDFILMTGDVVSNANLADIVRQHKERKAVDKQMAMTVVCRRGGGGEHRSSSPSEELFVACEADSKKILHFQRCRSKKSFDVPVDVFQDCDGDVELRHDLIDPGIAVCSPIVPQIFSDDFDYLTRDDFIKGLLVHQEIMGNSLYLATIEDAYAARALDLATYNAISQDVLARWTFPLTPDLFPPPAHNTKSSSSSSKCRFGHGSVYRSADVVLGPNAVLEANAVVGSGSQVGADSRLTNSVVGERCVIGINVVLDGALVFDDVIIGDGCRISRSVLASGVALGAGVTLEPGCVLGSKVKVGVGIGGGGGGGGGVVVVLPSGTQLTTAEEFGPVPLGADVVGPGGFAYRYAREDSDDEEDDDEDDDDEEDGVKKLADVFCWWEADSRRGGDDDDDDDDDSSSNDDDDDGDGEGDDDDEDVDGDAAGSEEEGEDEEMKDLKQFHDEVVDTLWRGVEENVSSENLVLEINSLKQAYFIYISEVQQCVVKCVLEAPIVKLSLAGKPLLLHVRKHGFPLLKNYVKDAEAQRLALVALASLCVGGGAAAESGDVRSRASEVLTPFLGLLYNEDIIADSDVVFDWFAQQSDPEVKKLFAPFVKNLREAEEDEDDDDDDDEDDDDDDD